MQEENNQNNTQILCTKHSIMRTLVSTKLYEAFHRFAQDKSAQMMRVKYTYLSYTTYTFTDIPDELNDY